MIADREGADGCPTPPDADRPSHEEDNLPVLNRSELAASPLADLHALASEMGLDGFRRLRKADLIDLIVQRQGGEDAAASDPVSGAGGDRRAEPGGCSGRLSG